MAYLVTGGFGLIGTRIVRDLVRQGEQVVIYDVLSDGPALHQLLSEEERAKIKFARGDMTDLPLIMRTVKDNNVDRIIHMASILNEAADANPLLALKVICEGTLNIFETARILGLKKVVWASTVGVFGPPEKYSVEYLPNNALHSPWGVYGACKSLNENLAVHYFNRWGVDNTALRYTRVYGTGRPGGKAVVTELMENPAIGKPGRVPLGDDVPDWLYVDDAARATVLAARVPKTKTRAYNVGGEIRSIKEVAEYVRKLLPGADITLLPGTTGMSWKYESTVIEEELGFRPEWHVERGVREIINETRRQHGLPPV